MVTLRRTSLHLSALALVSSTLIVAAPLAAHAATTNPTTTALITATKAALKKETGVHVKVAAVASKVHSSVVADIGKSSGTEQYVSGDVNFRITVTPTYAYLGGSKKGLISYMQLSAAEQKTVGSASISMKKGTSPYTSFKTNLTSGTTFLSLLPTAKGTTVLAARDKKTNGYQLSWTAKATSTQPKTSTIMTISSGKKTLPIKEVVTTSTSKSVTTFTKWGENVKVSVPSSTIAYSKVFPSS
jgi:hypothetical protein